MADVQPGQTSNQASHQLTCEAGRNEEKITGTTDVVVAEVRNAQNDALRNNVEALLELFKAPTI